MGVILLKNIHKKYKYYLLIYIYIRNKYSFKSYRNYEWYFIIIEYYLI